MYTLATPVKSYITQTPDACIDNKVFRLHCKLTAAILIFFSTIYFAKEIVGEPILCIGDSKTSDETMKTITSYCWITSTYTVDKYFEPKHWKKGIYPGVGPLNRTQSTTQHKYYLWIPFFFFAIAILSYFPFYLWNQIEEGKMKMLMEKLNTPIPEEEVKNTRLELLTNYFIGNMGLQDSYFYKFFACEILNFFIVILTFYLTDVLLGYKFSTYGTDWIHHVRNNGRNQYNQEVPNPMDKVFPKLTKCEFTKYGPTGNQIPLDIICTLGVNNCNDKFFLFLWFYFISLMLISGLHLLIRLTNFFPTVRIFLLKHKFFKGRQRNENHVRIICDEFLIGDWFVLFQLRKNIDKVVYADLVYKLSLELHNKKSTV